MTLGFFATACQKEKEWGNQESCITIFLQLRVVAFKFHKFLPLFLKQSSPFDYKFSSFRSKACDSIFPFWSFARSSGPSWFYPITDLMGDNLRLQPRVRTEETKVRRGKTHPPGKPRRPSKRICICGERQCVRSPLIQLKPTLHACRHLQNSFTSCIIHKLSVAQFLTRIMYLMGIFPNSWVLVVEYSITWHACLWPEHANASALDSCPLSIYKKTHKNLQTLKKQHRIRPQSRVCAHDSCCHYLPSHASVKRPWMFLWISLRSRLICCLWAPLQEQEALR